MPDTHPTALEYPITVTDIAKLTGCTVEFVTQVTGETGDIVGLRYRKLEGDEERAVISEIEKALGGTASTVPAATRLSAGNADGRRCCAKSRPTVSAPRP